MIRYRDQPGEHRIRVHFEHPRGAPDPQAFGQARDDAYDEIDRHALSMQEGAMGFLEITVAGHTLELPPRLAPRVTVGTEVAPACPAVIRAILIGTELLLGVDGPRASSCEREQRRRVVYLQSAANSLPPKTGYNAPWITPCEGGTL